MSMKQTKGKQKIEMKKIEDNGVRMVTFSKRKAGIFKKLNELVAMYDVEVAFLVFSEAGTPFSFAHPSMEKVAARLNNPRGQEPLAKDDTGSLVKAYKNRKIQGLTTKSEALEEELAKDQEQLKLIKESRKEKNLDKMWWNVPPEGLGVKEVEQMHQAFVELHDNLCKLVISRLVKDVGGSSSGSSGRDQSGCGEADYIS